MDLEECGNAARVIIVLRFLREMDIYRVSSAFQVNHLATIEVFREMVYVHCGGSNYNLKKQFLLLQMVLPSKKPSKMTST